MEAVPRLHMLWFALKSSPEGTSFVALKKVSAVESPDCDSSAGRDATAVDKLINFSCWWWNRDSPTDSRWSTQICWALFAALSVLCCGVRLPRWWRRWRWRRQRLLLTHRNCCRSRCLISAIIAKQINSKSIRSLVLILSLSLSHCVSKSILPNSITRMPRPIPRRCMPLCPAKAYE